MNHRYAHFLVTLPPEALALRIGPFELLRWTLAQKGMHSQEKKNLISSVHGVGTTTM